MRDPRLAVRPWATCALPDYPGIAHEPARITGARYGGSALDRMRRPFLVLGLWASLALPAGADEEEPPVPPREAPREPEPREAGVVRMLSRDEIAGLVSDLVRVKEESSRMVLGDVKGGQSGLVTEEEGRALLETLLQKNGYRIRRDARVRGSGSDFAADGYDEARQVGYEYLAADDADRARDLAGLEIDRARGERSILVLDARHYEYDVFSMEHLPSKAEAVDRLLEDVRRFLISLAEERR